MIVSTPLYRITITKPIRTSGLNEEKYPESACPTLDLRKKSCTPSELSSFVRRFIEFFYGREPGSIDGNSRLQDDIEDVYYGILPGMEKEYGKWGFDPKDRENTGISSQGLSIYLLIQCSTDAMGLVVNEVENLLKLCGSIPLFDIETVGDFERCLAIMLRCTKRLIE